MKALKIVGVLLGLLILFITLLGLFAPGELKVEKDIHLRASRATVWKHLVDMQARDQWSPWRDYDPAMQVAFAGPRSGVGAISRWEGEEVGVGEQEITAVTDMEKIDTKIRFLEPMNGEMDTWFVLNENQAGGTDLLWGGYTEMSFPWNALGVLMGMKKATAQDFETGLNKLKPIVEEEAKNTWGYQVQEISYPGGYFVGKRGIVRFDEMQQFYATHLPAIEKQLKQRGIETAGMPCGLYYQWNDKEQSTEMAAAIPLTAPVEVPGYESITIPSGEALLVEYYGDYENLSNAHWAIDDYIAVNSIRCTRPIIEQYVTDPGAEADPTQWLTKIYYLKK